jgi:hypothetical protein
MSVEIVVEEKKSIGVNEGKERKRGKGKERCLKIVLISSFIQNTSSSIFPCSLTFQHIQTT